MQDCLEFFDIENKKAYTLTHRAQSDNIENKKK
jgi:hypothetical protein